MEAKTEDETKACTFEPNLTKRKGSLIPRHSSVMKLEAEKVVNRLYPGKRDKEIRELRARNHSINLEKNELLKCTFTPNVRKKTKTPLRKSSSSRSIAGFNSYMERMMQSRKSKDEKSKYFEKVG